MKINNIDVQKVDKLPPKTVVVHLKQHDHSWEDRGMLLEKKITIENLSVSRLSQLAGEYGNQGNQYAYVSIGISPDLWND